MDVRITHLLYIVLYDSMSMVMLLSY